MAKIFALVQASKQLGAKSVTCGLVRSIVKRPIPITGWLLTWEAVAKTPTASLGNNPLVLPKAEARTIS